MTKTVERILLIAVILGLRSVRLRGLIFHIGDMCALSHQCVSETLSLALVELEYRAVKSPVGIEILHGQGVVLLVREQADQSPATVWCRGLAQRRRGATHLLVFNSEREVLDGFNAH